MSSTYMAMYMKNYRSNKPEYYEKEKSQEYNKYLNDPEYRQKKKEKALERYYRLKELKQNNQSILSN